MICCSLEAVQTHVNRKRDIHSRYQPIYQPLRETNEIPSHQCVAVLTGPATVKTIFNKEMPVGIVSPVHPYDKPQENCTTNAIEVEQKSFNNYVNEELIVRSGEYKPSR